VLVTLGVCADGRQVLLDMRIAGEDSELSWGERFNPWSCTGLECRCLALG